MLYLLCAIISGIVVYPYIALEVRNNKDIGKHEDLLILACCALVAAFWPIFVIAVTYIAIVEGHKKLKGDEE